MVCIKIMNHSPYPGLLQAVDIRHVGGWIKHDSQHNCLKDS